MQDLGYANRPGRYRGLVEAYRAGMVLQCGLGTGEGGREWGEWYDGYELPTGLALLLWDRLRTGVSTVEEDGPGQFCISAGGSEASYWYGYDEGTLVLESARAWWFPAGAEPPDVLLFELED